MVRVRAGISILRAVVALLGALLIVAMCGGVLLLLLDYRGVRQEYRERVAVLEPLLETHASKEEVFQTLRLQFTDYSIGSTNRRSLWEGGLASEIRQRASRYPGVYFHTTADWKTWLFFDSTDQLQDFFVGPQ